MTSPNYSDEILMCFADGELDEETQIEIAAALDIDPALAERVALFMQTRELSAKAMQALLDEPVPAALRERVERMAAENQAEQAQVVPIGSAGRSRRPRLPLWIALPVAASIAAVAGGYVGWSLAPGNGPSSDGLALAGLGAPQIVDALTNVSSGEPATLAETGQRFIGIASFIDASGALCREFELDSPAGGSIVSVACRGEADWDVRLAIAAPTTSSSYAPASSTETLDAYLTAIGAGDPLSSEAERAALEKLVAEPGGASPSAE